MTQFLLNVNVLIAMAWPAHHAHAKVQDWLAKNAALGWATCPFTETGFVRILSNPAFSPHALSVVEAAQLLGANLEHPAHHFWPDEVGLLPAIAPFQKRLLGHQQITDAYLLGLALRRKGKLATLDGRIGALLPTGSPQRAVVVAI